MIPTDRDPTNNTNTATLEAPVATNIDTKGIRTCPDCGSAKIGRARRRRIDRIISLVNIYPYSCRIHTCKARFYSFGNSGK
ncbi:hypothetical protein [Chamaesiphon sp. VAR_69_metabat_338]|uniref:hypothetical protein n=1 Tax=Chamaesiphon sp. VAR_69_metabat_338 TaxID=2964704 RepID=UPI00286DBADE|nr:hypothetical protein [Chamaesiphon sp. VAR_69_metabat_338]